LFTKAEMVPNNQLHHDSLLGADLFASLLDGFSPIPSPTHIPSYMNSPDMRPAQSPPTAPFQPLAPPGSGHRHPGALGDGGGGGGREEYSPSPQPSVARPPELHQHQEASLHQNGWMEEIQSIPTQDRTQTRLSQHTPPPLHPIALEDSPTMIPSRNQSPESMYMGTTPTPRANRKRCRVLAGAGSSQNTDSVERKKNREKQRRLDVNNKFEELHELVSKVEESKNFPNRGSGTANKVEVLTRAIKVIKHLWVPAGAKNPRLLPKEHQTPAPIQEVNPEESAVPKPLAAAPAPAMPQWPMIIMPMFMPNPSMPQQQAPAASVPSHEGGTAAQANKPAAAPSKASGVGLPGVVPSSNAGVVPMGKLPKGFSPITMAAFTEQMRASTEALKESMASSADEVTTHACAA